MCIVLGVHCIRKYLIIVNTWRPRQNGRRFAEDTFKRIFINENVRIFIKISLKFVSKGRINNNPALVQIMAWRRSGDKPLSEPMIVYWCIYVSLCLNELNTISWITFQNLTNRSQCLSIWQSPILTSILPPVNSQWVVEGQYKFAQQGPLHYSDDSPR